MLDNQQQFVNMVNSSSPLHIALFMLIQSADNVANECTYGSTSTFRKLIYEAILCSVHEYCRNLYETFEASGFFSFNYAAHESAFYLMDLELCSE